MQRKKTQNACETKVTNAKTEATRMKRTKQETAKSMQKPETKEKT